MYNKWIVYVNPGFYTKSNDDKHHHYIQSYRKRNTRSCKLWMWAYYRNTGAYIEATPYVALRGTQSV